MEPKISIIIPAYNAEKYVREAVLSALNQSYPHIEVIVVNDGSIDQTLEQIQDIQDSRLFVHSQINQGACVARNYGISVSTGDYIKFLDADDVLHKDALRLQWEATQNANENEIIFGDYDMIDSEGRVFYENKINAETFAATPQPLWLMGNWDILISTPLYPKSALVQTKGFNIKLTGGQESFLHWNLSMSGFVFIYAPGNVFSYRTHNSKDRISVQRLNRLPNFHEVVFRSETMLQIIDANKPSCALECTTGISQSYFNMALSYFDHDKKEEGHYCLSRALAIPHSSYPKFKKSSVLGRILVCTMHILGYCHTMHWINFITSKFIHKKKTPEKIQMVLRPVAVQNAQ